MTTSAVVAVNLSQRHQFLPKSPTKATHTKLNTSVGKTGYKKGRTWFRNSGSQELGIQLVLNVFVSRVRIGFHGLI